MLLNLIEKNKKLRNYFTVTMAYWGFTLTDGAIRMLIVLYFHQLGYSPLEIAMLFVFYELCGVFTNFIGGWLGSRFGLNQTMNLGILLQIISLTHVSCSDRMVKRCLRDVCSGYVGCGKRFKQNER